MQPDTIIGVSFGDSFRAQEFLSAVTRLNSLGQLTLLDAVIVTKADDGRTKVKETVDLQPGRAAISGAVWTGLLGLIVGGPVGWIAGLGVGAGAGAIAARLVDVGIPDDWVDWFKAAVEPESFTVVILASALNTDALVAEVARFEGAHLVYANVDPYLLERIERALGESVDETGTADASRRSEPGAPLPPPE